jgi:ribose transport system substrate-binding protein
MSSPSNFRLLAGLLAGVLLAGCSSGSSGDNQQPATRVRLAFVTNTAADFWTMARKGCEQADKELDSVEKYPDIAGLVGLWAYNGPAILNAVREAGKVGKIKIVAFDEDDQTLAGVKDGSIHGTVVQQPYEFGYQAIKLLSEILAGDRSGIPASRQLFIPTLIIKKENVDEFAARVAALRK